MNRTALKTAPEPELWFARHFEEVLPRLPGARFDWVREMREAAFARYPGLPTRRVEAWKYTDLSRLGHIDMAPAELADVPPITELPPGIAAVEGHLAVFVNGHVNAGLSQLDRLPPGAWVAGVADMLEREPEWMRQRLGTIPALDDHPMAALNTAFLDGGAVVRLREGVLLDEPLHLVFIGATAGEALAFHPRNLIVIEPGAVATVVESHVGTGGQPYLSNGAAEITVGSGAILRHCKLQNESAAAFHLAATGIRLEDGATYDGFVLHLGGRLARHEVLATLEGGRIEFRLDGAYLGAGEAHHDITTVIDHVQPGSRSRQTFKGVLDDHARGVFQGRLVVRPGAQKTDAHQLSRAVLLSPAAEMDGKPELEIYADDVKCGHGASIGELDRAQLFYLESRGLDETTARRLLVEGFIGEVIDAISDPLVRPALAARVRGWLDERWRGAA